MSGPIIAIVGAGPAGVRAAARLACAGLRPVLIDEAARPGGQIYRQPPHAPSRSARDLYGSEATKAARVHAALAPFGDRIDHRRETLAWNIFEHRIDLHGPDGFAQLSFDRLILATGAMDRVIPIPGWTLPGVFTLGAAQIALKAQGCSIGRRVAFVGSGPLLPLVALQYARAGAEVVAVLDTAPFSAKRAAVVDLLAQPGTFAKGLAYMASLMARGIAPRHGIDAPRITGGSHVSGIAWTERGAERRVACDAVAIGFALRSETQLADLAGCAFAWDGGQRQYLPTRDIAGRSSLPHVYLAGDGAGIAGADAAEAAGERAALAVLEDIGAPVDRARLRALDAGRRAVATFRRGLDTAFPFPVDLARSAPADLVVCRCEAITAGTLRHAARVLDATELNRVKAFTRLGMGRCQGRVCAAAAAEIVAAERGVEVREVGRLRGQAPVKPIPMHPAPPVPS